MPIVGFDRLPTFELKANVRVSSEAITGQRETPWRGKRQFRRARARLRGEHRRWAHKLPYHPRLAISRAAYDGALLDRYLVPQIVAEEDRLIMEAWKKECGHA